MNQIATVLGCDNQELLAARFAAKVEFDGDCMRWIGAIKSNGYGVMSIAGKNQHAHRVALLLSGQDLTPGMVVDHLCRNRWCVNPEHLEMVTKSENAVRGIPGQQKSHCKRGHPFAEGNMYVYGKRRFCRTCAIERSKARWAEASKCTH